MTDPNYTAIQLIVDRSGSMADIRQSAEAAINEFVKGQADHSYRTTVRLSQFDTSHDVIYPSTPANRCPYYELEPRGGTALLDAMGLAITEFGKELAALPETKRPGTVILAVMTDGEENSSFQYSYDDINKMVTHQRDVYKWEILYLGANQDAIAEAAKMGIRRGQALAYAGTDTGYRTGTSVLDSYAVTASSGMRTNTSFTDEDREKAAEE